MMKTFLKKHYPALAIVAVAITAAVLSSSVAQLRDPETEFSQIRAELAAALDRIDASLKISTQSSSAPENVVADENFVSALKYYTNGDFPAVVKMLNVYLEQSQVPEHNRYLKAQYLLGRSYEQLGRPTQSMRAYLRYIASFLTAKPNGHDEFLDVLHRTVNLSINAGQLGREADTLISSLTSIDLPTEVKNVVNLIAAKSSVLSQNSDVASRLIEETLKNSGDRSLKAKAHYIKALIAISKKNYDDAEEHLADATHAEVDPETKDLARLGLARLATKRNKPETALKYYGLIDEKSEKFKDALFESIYLHANLDQDNEARAKSLLFLARFKDTTQAIQLRMILAYLDLRAGDYDAAKVTLENAEQRVNEVDQFLYKNLMYKSNVSASDLTTLSALTAGHINDIPAIKDAASNFARLSELVKHLADIDSEIRSVTFALSNAGLEGINPVWINRSEQLAEVGDSLLAIGHRLLGTERHLYDQSLDELVRQKLLISENRRTKLLDPTVSLKRKHINWKSFRDYLQVYQSVKESSVRLATAEAELSAVRYAKEKQNKSFPVETVNKLQTTIRQLKSRHEVLAQQANLIKVKTSGNEGPHHGAKLFLSHYAGSLEEEVQLIEEARESQTTTAQKMFGADAKEFWKIWRFAVGRVLEGFNELDLQVNRTLTETGKTLEELSTRQAQLLGRLSALNSTIETILGGNLNTVLNQYSAELTKKSGRNKKWKADIEWLEFQKSQDKEQTLNQKHNLEQQVLNENLRDIKQGLIW